MSLQAETMVQDVSASLNGVGESFQEARNRAKGRRRQRVRSTLSCASFRDLFATGERLGGGAYASVWSCWRKSPLNTEEARQQFAVKIIEKIPTHSRQRCLNEVELFFKCRSNKHIIRMEETFDEEDAFYIVFEKVNGGPLMKAIARSDTISEKEVVAVVKELADAIAFLHSINIAHRDLKPDNILCVNTTSISPIKLCDLDLGSKIEINHPNDETVTPQLMTPVGSAEYMAPEVVEGFVSDEAGPYDKRCDLWSLGVVIYIMLCGYPPFVGNCGDDCDWPTGGNCYKCQDLLFTNIQEGNFDFPAKDWDKVDPEAKDLVRQLLVKDPKKRISAQMILNHPWVIGGGSNTLLNTTLNINKMNFGCAKVSNFASSAMELNSIQMQHSYGNFYESSSESDDTIYGNSPPKNSLTPPSHGSSSPKNFLTPPLHNHFNSLPLQQYEDEVPLGLSPPTASLLLQRRSLERRLESKKKNGTFFIPQLAH